MHLSDHDLRQLDDAYLAGLTPEQARALLSKVLADLKAARERLAQDPSNSSRPPSSRAPWEGVDGEPEADVGDGDVGVAGPTSGDAAGEAAEQAAGANKPHRRRKAGAGAKPGRRKGAPGHSRTQSLPINAEQVHAPAGCAACDRALDDGGDAHAYTAHYTLELIAPEGGCGGLALHQTKHVYLERRCGCGHATRAQPARMRRGQWR